MVSTGMSQRVLGQLNWNNDRINLDLPRGRGLIAAMIYGRSNQWDGNKQHVYKYTSILVKLINRCWLENLKRKGRYYPVEP